MSTVADEMFLLEMCATRSAVTHLWYAPAARPGHLPEMCSIRMVYAVRRGTWPQFEALEKALFITRVIRRTSLYTDFQLTPYGLAILKNRLVAENMKVAPLDFIKSVERMMLYGTEPWQEYVK